MKPITDTIPYGWSYFVSYIFICGIVVLNLFVGIVVDVVLNKQTEASSK